MSCMHINVYQLEKRPFRQNISTPRTCDKSVRLTKNKPKTPIVQDFSMEKKIFFFLEIIRNFSLLPLLYFLHHHPPLPSASPLPCSMHARSTSTACHATTVVADSGTSALASYHITEIFFSGQMFLMDDYYTLRVQRSAYTFTSRGAAWLGLHAVWWHAWMIMSGWNVWCR